MSVCYRSSPICDGIRGACNAIGAILDELTVRRDDDDDDDDGDVERHLEDSDNLSRFPVS